MSINNSLISRRDIFLGCLSTFQLLLGWVRLEDYCMVVILSMKASA